MIYARNRQGIGKKHFFNKNCQHPVKWNKRGTLIWSATYMLMQRHWKHIDCMMTFIEIAHPDVLMITQTIISAKN